LYLSQRRYRYTSKLIEALRTLAGKLTIVMVAHRLSAVALSCDRELVFADVSEEDWRELISSYNFTASGWRRKPCGHNSWRDMKALDHPFGLGDRLAGNPNMLKST
jgi:energy-coupling factor transporter ATP-binding protein EcfA2